MAHLDYWLIKAGIGTRGTYALPPFFFEYQMQPDKITKNPLIDINSKYVDYAYISSSQIANTDGRSYKGPFLARPEGGRSLTITDEDSLFTVGNNEFRVNVKGAGTTMIVSDYTYEIDGRTYTLCADSRSNINHTHLLALREGGNAFSMLYNLKGFGKVHLASLLTDKDFDSGASSHSHRPVGGQDSYIASEALNNSVHIKRDGIRMNICPVLSSVEISPGSHIETRCYGGDAKERCPKIKEPKYAQEIRLMPSNVRISHPNYDIGIASLTDSYMDMILSSIREDSTDVDDFLHNMIATSRQIYFLPYIARKEIKEYGNEQGAIYAQERYGRYDSKKIAGERYLTYTFAYTNTLSDTVLDRKGNAFYTDLESIDKKEQSKLELLLRSAGLARADTTEGLSAFLLTLMISSAVRYKGANYNIQKNLQHTREDYKEYLDGFLSDQSFIRISPQDKTITSYIDVDGDSMTVRHRFKGMRFNPIPKIIM